MTDRMTLDQHVADMDARISDKEGNPGSAGPVGEPPENRGHGAQSRDDAPLHWPAGVFPVSMQGLALLGVDNDGHLYWDGVPVEVSRTFSLSMFQRGVAVAVSLSAVGAAIAAGISAYADWMSIPHP